MNELIKQKIDPVVVFTGDGLDELLHNIEQECIFHEADLSTKSSRAEIASIAAKVASAKVAIDNAGKELVTEWKSKSKAVDISRKYSRDFLDSLKIRVREPLTDWEDAEKERIEKERLAAELIELHEEALQDDIILEKEKDLAVREILFKEREEAQRIRIQEENTKRERLAREEDIKTKTAEMVKLEVEQAAQRKIDEAKESEIRAKIALKQAETDRLESIAKAEQDKKDAVIAAELKAKEEAERVEAERLEKEKAEKLQAEEAEQNRLDKLAEEKEESDRLSVDINNRRKVNKTAHLQFMKLGIDSETAKNVIKLIASNQISNISINYR